jgi:hypothetical protein
MSQYPSPYSSPNPYSSPAQHPYQQDPYATNLGPAKLAGVATIVLGALALLGGVCIGLLGLAAPEEMVQRMIEKSGDPNESVAIMRVGFAVIGAIVLLYGIGSIVLGIFVLRGSVAAAITGIVLSAIAILPMLLNAAVAVPKMSTMNGAEAAGAGCVAFVGPMVMVAQLIMLIFALKACLRHRRVQEQYRAQYWQYQQQQQMYQQGVSGVATYGYPQAQSPSTAAPNPEPQNPPEQQ